MKKWTILCAALSLVLAGCGGGGDGGNDGGNNGGGVSDVSTVNLPDTPGLLNVAYITGQGRADGDLTAVLGRVYFTDSAGLVENPLSPERTILLQGYQSQMVSLNVDHANEPSRLFEEFTLDLNRILVETSPSTFTTVAAPPTLPLGFDAAVRVFPGRHSLLPVGLDDTMVSVAGSDSTFDEDAFRAVNLPDVDSVIQGRISDYVAFDISDMASGDRPLMSDGNRAGKLLVSGDGFILAADATQGYAEALIPSADPIEGRFRSASNVAGRRVPATYTLIQTDPRDLMGIARVTALQGIWRPVTEVVSNLSAFEFITFPSSADDEEQQLVIIVRSGGAITNLYYGTADFDSGDFTAYPVENVSTLSTTGELTGTLSALKNRFGGTPSSDQDVREGTFTFDAAPPAGFLATGRFIVFRR